VAVNEAGDEGAGDILRGVQLPAEDTDLRVRAAVYDRVMTAAAAPTAAQLAGELGLAPADVKASLERLASARVLVLQRDSRELLMANPFSAVPTPFAATVRGRLYFGNCIWDALGIPAMLAGDGQVDTSCGCCGEAMSLTIIDQRLAAAEGVVHFAIPAKRWWEDIVYN
jgi:Alkylmercury lyase